VTRLSGYWAEKSDGDRVKDFTPPTMQDDGISSPVVRETFRHCEGISSPVVRLVPNRSALVLPALAALALLLRDADELVDAVDDVVVTGFEILVPLTAGSMMFPPGSYIIVG
jgi:hypothetical protein